MGTALTQVPTKPSLGPRGCLSIHAASRQEGRGCGCYNARLCGSESWPRGPRLQCPRSLFRRAPPPSLPKSHLKSHALRGNGGSARSPAGGSPPLSTAHRTGALLGTSTHVLSVHAHRLVPGVDPTGFRPSRSSSLASPAVPAETLSWGGDPVPASPPPASLRPVRPPPSPLRSTWLDSAILGSQEAPSKGKAEPRPAGGAKGRRGSEGRALGGGRGGLRAAEAAAGLGAPKSPLSPNGGRRWPLPGRPASDSRYTRGKVFQRPLPSSPRLPLPRR